MLTEQRKRYLLALLAKDGRIVAKSAASDLNLSEDTIRRDLRELASEGKLQRVHGGARPASPAVGALLTRALIAPSEKEAIGRCAAAMILPGQLVFIDGGTTALQLAKHLDRQLNATIVTHSPQVATALCDHAVQVHLIGGRLFKQSMVIVGATALLSLKDFRPDVFFMGVTGIHPEAGLTTGDAEEAVMKRAIAEASGELVVMASSEKLLAASSFVILDTNRANTVLVPDDTKEATVRQFTSLGIEVIHAR
ncbi:MAG: DeoR/GlpR family DNA-binding transcription regulator [Hyphomonadaceae bacterium]